MCVCVHMCVSVCTRAHQHLILSVPLYCHLRFFETEFLTKPDAHQLARLADQEVPEIPPVYSLQGCAHPAPSLMWFMGIQTQPLTLVQ